MKKNILLFILFLGLGISTHVNAQETVPKEVVLTTLNSFNKLRLSNLKTSELMEYNEGYVEKVYKILESEQLEQDQKEDLKILAQARERDLTNLLGSSKTRKYAHLTDREMRLPVHKNKLLKYIY
jgi:hypothetical protein